MTYLLLALSLPAEAAPVAPGAPAAASAPRAALPGSPLSRTFAAAAEESGVPEDLLYALAFEASGLQRHDAPSAWGGRTMFDLVEDDEVGGPSLERASALLSLDPNAVVADWRLAARAAAALLADEAREIGHGALPAADDLDAWQPAVAAFSGRDEPNLQQLYVSGVYQLLAAGFEADTALGRVVVAPAGVTVPHGAAPPPSSTDYPSAESWVPACGDNYSDDARGAGDIDMVVIHTVQGSYSGCSSWFQNCSAGASAHYVVSGSTGGVTQMVREADIAWHAGNWDVNVRSVGIEHEGYVSDCSDYTDALYRGSAKLTADIAARQGVPLDRSHIIGHDEVPDPYNPGEYGGAGHHTDPGSCWDWDYYMGLIGGETGTTTGEITGYVRENDIYNTEGNLVGASVWIAETGDTTTVDGDGLYRFDGVPYGTYTIHAVAAGYAEGTCTSGLNASQDWCSIALFPGGDDTGTGTDTGVDSGSADSGVDSGPGNDPTDGAGDGRPGQPVAFGDVEPAGCGCETGTAPLGGALVLLGLGAALARRR